MSLPTIDPYLETFFWLTSAWKKEIPSGYVRRDDIVRWYADQMMTATERFGPRVCRPHSHLAGDLFDRMLEAGFVATEINEIAGSYFAIDPQSVSGFRNKCLEGNPIYVQYQRVGARLFDDIFEVYDRSEESESFQIVDSTVAPASDRIVKFDHNEPDAAEISTGLKQIYEDVRGANDPSIEEEDRKRVIAGIDAAISIWNAGQFQLIQLKVGVLLAVEEAAKLLKSTSKSVGVGLIVDAIKAFAKNKFNADLDLF